MKIRIFGGIKFIDDKKLAEKLSSGTIDDLDLCLITNYNKLPKNTGKGKPKLKLIKGKKHEVSKIPGTIFR